MKDRKQIIRWVEEILEGTDKFLVEVLVKPGERIHVFIDGDTGITVDDCARVSRFLESKMDREQEDYELTVSSHGADQPLLFPRQYRKNIGRSLKIALSDGNQVTGQLIGADDQKIIIRPEAVRKSPPAPDREISYHEITTAKLVISFKGLKQ